MATKTEEGMLGTICGQVVVITGAGRGLGRVYAEKLAGLGAHVVLMARSLDRLYEVSEAIRALGGQAICVEADVMDRQGVARAFSQIDQHHGHIDLLINNAGNVGPIGASWELDSTEWWNTFELHLLGSFHSMQEALRRMMPLGGGRIINIASHAGAYRWPKVSAYSVAKAALIKLTENVAVEARRAVTLFAYHPGIVRDTGFVPDIYAAYKQSADPGSSGLRDLCEWGLAQIAAGHTVTADQSAYVLAQLASGGYDFLNGRYITVYDDLEELRAKAKQIRKGEAGTMRVSPILPVQKVTTGSSANETVETVDASG